MVNHYNTILSYPNQTGAMPLLLSIRDGVPFAFSSLLFIIFFVLFAGQYFLTKERTGRAKIFVALISSSLVSLVLSLLLFLSQLVTYLTVLLYAFITIVAFAVLVISDKS